MNPAAWQTFRGGAGNRWGADLGWEDAAKDMAFAGALGSAFSAAGTSIGHIKATKPNQLVSAETRGLLEERLMGAGRTMEEAAAEADIAIRQHTNLARITGADPNAIIEQKLHFAREGEAVGEAATVSYSQGMYRSQARHIQDFITESLANPDKTPKSFFILDNPYDQTVLELSSDQVIHIKDGHPDFDDWEIIPEVIANGEKTPVGKNGTTGTETFVYKLDDNGESVVVIAAPDVGGRGRKNKPARTVILSAFRENERAVNNWLATKKAALSPSDEALHLNPHPTKQMIPSGPEGGDSKIAKFDQEVNELLAKKVNDLRSLYQDKAGGWRPKTSEENAAHGLEAMNKAIAERTDALDAMYRPNLGSISFYWGEPGTAAKGFHDGNGVSHIIAARNFEGESGEEVARKLVQVLAHGEEVRTYGPADGLRKDLAYDGHTATVSLYRFRNRETWLLTGWKDKSPGAQEGFYNPQGYASQPSGSRDEKGAGASRNSLTPLGADGKPLFQAQTAGAGPPRGRLDILPDNNYRVVFGQGADASTAVHEFQHLFIEEARRIMELPAEQIADAQAFAGLKGGMKAAENWAGVKGDQPLNAEQGLAARNLWASSGQKLSELADLAVQAPTKENLFAFRKMVEVHRAIQNEVINTEAWRTFPKRTINSRPSTGCLCGSRTN